jgi:hypothetical protein
MYLVDTNVWLERLLDQNGSAEVGRFLSHVEASQLPISDFSFHSLSLIMDRLNRRDALWRFVQDAFVDGSVGLVRLEPADTEQIIRFIDRFQMDYDDAYQYTCASEYELTIVSFDSDFDRTDLGKKRPGQIVES